MNYSFITEIIAPSIGLVTATSLYVAPLSAVNKAQKTTELNIFALACQPICCLAWVLYACMLRGTVLNAMFVLGSNFPGVILGFYFVSKVFRLSDLQDNHIRMINIVVGVGLVLDIIGLAIGTIFLRDAGDLQLRSTIAGALAITVLLIFYAAPLSILYRVIKTRDASAFSKTQAGTTIVNALVWLVFGLCIGDPIIWSPNVLAVINGTIQLYCCMTMSSSKSELELELPPEKPKKNANVGPSDQDPCISPVATDNQSDCDSTTASFHYQKLSGFGTPMREGSVGSLLSFDAGMTDKEVDAFLNDDPASGRSTRGNTTPVRASKLGTNATTIVSPSAVKIEGDHPDVDSDLESEHEEEVEGADAKEVIVEEQEL